MEREGVEVQCFGGLEHCLKRLKWGASVDKSLRELGARRWAPGPICTPVEEIEYVIL